MGPEGGLGDREAGDREGLGTKRGLGDRGLGSGGKVKTDVVRLVMGGLGSVSAGLGGGAAWVRVGRWSGVAEACSAWGMWGGGVTVEGRLYHSACLLAVGGGGPPGGCEAVSVTTAPSGSGGKQLPGTAVCSHLEPALRCFSCTFLLTHELPQSACSFHLRLAQHPLRKTRSLSSPLEHQNASG